MLTLPAPAKLNLSLRVIGERPDGYHDIQTVYQFVDLGECISFESSPGGGLRIEGLPEGAHRPDAPSTVHRSCAAFAERTGCGALHLRIRVDKRTPMGGGLGGGSSDAATVLHGLNLLCRAGLDTRALGELGAGIGADVPLFIHGRSAIGSGRGDELEPCTPDEGVWCIVHPGISCSTAAMFTHSDLTPSGRIRKIPALLRDRQNDFQSLARQLHPQIESAWNWLKRFAEPRLSGTGSCIFAGFASLDAARQVAASVPDGWTSWAVRGINRSPLLTELERVNGV